MNVTPASTNNFKTVAVNILLTKAFGFGFAAAFLCIKIASDASKHNKALAMITTSVSIFFLSKK